jgi:hypothetical protein
VTAKKKVSKERTANAIKREFYRQIQGMIGKQVSRREAYYLKKLFREYGVSMAIYSSMSLI